MKHNLYSFYNFSIFATLILLTFPVDPSHDALIGFTVTSSQQELELEEKFDTFISAERIGDRIKLMSSQPNHLGSPHQYQNALYLDSLFTAWGFDSQIEKFTVLFPTPKERILELVYPTSFKASLVEPAFDEDATSTIHEGSLPPYNAYAGDGEVTAELVYVNQGIPDDYKELEKRGISVEGKIVIARYGGSWRGIKPKVAYEHGAVGCILYSDPKDDGYSIGDTYPEGSWRPKEGVQRGSVMDMPVHPGDPLTPGIGATEEASRIKKEDSKVILKIPVLPISYEDALPLLESMEGPVAPPSWRGGLPITYHIGSGPTKVHMKTTFSWDLVPLYNVIATLKGSQYPDQWVVRGNHMDAWVFGATDPLSGNSAMMEEACALGQLVKSGWNPKRTIVYASWDGEEPGLLGSTEWVEKHAEELRKKAVVYINTDSNTRGFLKAGGSHSLQHFVNEVGQSIIDPQTDISVIDRLRAKQMVQGNKEVSGDNDLSIYPLGSGSDYTPFLQHLGISSLNIGYGGEGGGGEYHSRYDSYDHLRRFGDPSFTYGATLSKTTGRMVLRFANADILPHRFSDMAQNIEHYLKEIKQTVESMREETNFHHNLHQSNSYDITADPTKTYFAPKIESIVPYFNFAPLENAIVNLVRMTAKYDKTLISYTHDNVDMNHINLQSINTFLQSIEHLLTDPDGLPKRPWYVHRIYAPGYYTGYGVKTLPGVREAIEQREWDAVSEQTMLTAEAINRYADGIEEATRFLE